MNLTRFADAEEFQERAEDFLLEHEAENCLMLGISGQLVRSPESVKNESYLATVEEGGIIAAALATPPYKLILSFGMEPEAGSLIAGDLQDAYPDLPGVLAPLPDGRQFAEAWRELTGCSFRQGMEQRVYRLENVELVPEAAGWLRPATEKDLGLLREWFAAFDREALGGSGGPESATEVVERFMDLEGDGLYLWEDGGEPVSMAGHSGTTPNGVRVNMVYTPPHLRRRGYATASVAALSRMLLGEGRKFCFLFTDLANPTSNSVYRRIGYEPVCDVEEYWFE